MASCSIMLIDSSEASTINKDLSKQCKYEETTLEINVSFPVYLIAFMSFFSWILFCMFGGIGISAIPLDLFYDFCTRPKRRTLEEMTDIKKIIIANSQKVKNLAIDVKDIENKGVQKKFFLSAQKREYNDKLTKLRAATYILDKEYKMYKIQTGLNEQMVCQYWLGLILGIFAAIISLAWLVHM